MSIKQEQENALAEFLRGNDVFAASGFGKSLVYQLATLVTKMMFPGVLFRWLADGSLSRWVLPPTVSVWGGIKSWLILRAKQNVDGLTRLKIFLNHRQNEALISNQRVYKDRWSPPSSFYILRLAGYQSWSTHTTVLCLHSYKYCMVRLTSPFRIPVRYYTTTSWQHVRWLLLNTSKSKARHSETTAAVQWEGKWVNTHTCTHTHIYTHVTHTHTCLSSFWAVFQCAIFSAERPQSCLWNLGFMTAWSVPYSNYRW